MIVTYRKTNSPFTLKHTPIDYSGGRFSDTINRHYRNMNRKKRLILEHNDFINKNILFEEAFIKARERQEKVITKLFGKRIVEEVNEIYIRKISENCSRENISSISFVENPITFLNTRASFNQVHEQHTYFTNMIDSLLENVYVDVNMSSLYSDTEHLNKMIRAYKKYSCARLLFKSAYLGDQTLFSMRLLRPSGYRQEEGSILNDLGYSRHFPNSRALLEDNYSYAVLLLTPRSRVRKSYTFNEGILTASLPVKVSLTDFENYFNMFGVLLSNAIEYYVTMEDIKNIDVRQSGWTKMARDILDVLPGLSGFSKFRRIQCRIAEMNPVAIGSLKKNIIRNLPYN